jgi:Conjugative transposon protein TcpC
MARRAVLERTAEFTADAEGPPRQPHSVLTDQATSHWRGAGGRWLIWVARAIAWAVLLLIGYRGVLAIIQGPAPSTPASSSNLPSGSAQFPVSTAEAYALQFGDVYLNFSPADATVRNQELAKFLPPGTDPSLGFDGAGTQRVRGEQVAGISVTGRHTAIVTLLARLSNGRMIELGVPIYATAGAMSVSGYPALLPGPGKAVPPPASQQTSDQVTEAALQAQLPAFFQAYASGDQGTLARFTTPGAHITGLHNDVSFGGIDSVYVPAGGSTRRIAVTVSWQQPSAAATSAKSTAVGIASAALHMTYQMTVVRQGGSWDIRSLGASTRPLAQGPP